MKTMQQLAQEAIEVQDACSMLGVTKSMARAVQGLSDNLRAMRQSTGTDQINQHPITKLWASKIHDLARMGESDAAEYGDAYSICQVIANGIQHATKEPS